MQTKRTEVEARIVRLARGFLDELGDGLQLTAAEYGAFSHLSAAFRDLDALEVPAIHGDDHPANALGPDTEHNAAATTTMLRSKVRRAVIEQLLILRYRNLYGMKGLTCQQIEKRLDGEHTTVSSAVNWLLNAGWVEDSGARRLNRSGKPAIVWALTASAIEATKAGLT